MRYCYVKDGGIGAPTSLPRNWRNISNFHALEPGVLAEYGWFQFVPNVLIPAFDPAAQRLEEKLQFDGVQVSQTWAVVALTEAERIAYATAIITEIGSRIDAFLNQQSDARKYNSIGSAISWNQSRTKYKTDGQQALDYRDTVWELFDGMIAGVQAGTTPLPTVDGWFASLPVLWPPPPPPPNNGNGTGNGTN